MPLVRISRDIHVPSPAPGTHVTAPSFYVAKTGVELLRYESYETRSDIIDAIHVRRSLDNGRTWVDDHVIESGFAHPAGTGRRNARGGYLDPVTGRYITITTVGVLPTDHPLEGMRQWTIHYAVYDDGGRTPLYEGPLVHEGPEYSATHPLPGVTTGKNCVMSGDYGEQPLTRADGVILMPLQSTPVGPDGDYHNPGKGFTYTDCLVALGRWQPDGSLAWTTSERIVGDPERSTRGMIEPTLAELTDGSLIMVMRGSNDKARELPGYRWISRSTDGGLTWTTPEPWTGMDGVPVHSPSSCSQLVRHSSGRLFWFGNLCKENPVGNGPRYPLVAVEVDQDRGLLKLDTLAVVDDIEPGDNPSLTLSNFYVREDRETQELLVFTARLFARSPVGGPTDWTSDALIYRMAWRD